MTIYRIIDLAWLEITLTDVNDNAPRFIQPYYTATIREGPCDTSVPLANITVVDDDLPEQGPFKFTFGPDGNPDNRFQLRDGNNYDTTKLYCSGNINRGSIPVLKVTIMATDNPSASRPVPGGPTVKPPVKLTSNANVFIHVKDRDSSDLESNAKLKVIVYSVNGKFVGGPIAKTYFKDNDGDDYGRMTYTISAGSDEFAVNRDNGWISAKSTVKVGNYEFKIQGEKDTRKRSCSVDVTVRSIPEEAIENSAAVQFLEVLDTNEFLNPILLGKTNNFESLTYYDRFVNMLSELFDVVAANVFVFSVQMSKQVKPYRAYPAIDVHFSIKKESSAKSSFLPRWILINILEHNNKTLNKIGKLRAASTCPIRISFLVIFQFDSTKKRRTSFIFVRQNRNK